MICVKSINSNNKKISNNEKLVYGATAGVVATTITHPLDVARHRLLCYNNIKSIRHAILDIYKLFKGFF